MARVIVLGAKGRFGRAAASAFADAGWSVTAFGRNWEASSQMDATRVDGDAKDHAALAAACQGHDVIVNAINPPYEHWAKELPGLTASVIHAARTSGATVMIPGNVYNYGAGMPEVLREDTPWQPTTRKGTLRVEMEHAFKASSVPTIVLRAGDFMEREKTGNWFDSYIAAKAQAGKITYPGPMDQIHAWAYLPDMARAMVHLAERRATFGPFEEFGFEGYTLTGTELVALISQTIGMRQKVSGMPWWLLRLIGLVSPQIREVMEMRYLWQVPHGIDGARFRKTVPEFVPTPVPAAFKAMLGPQNVAQGRESLSFSAHSA